MMHDSTATRRRAMVEPLIRLVINAAIPVLVYLLVRPHVHSDLTALAVWIRRQRGGTGVSGRS